MPRQTWLQKTAGFAASGFFMGYLLVTGCATIQTDAVLENKNNYPQQVELTSVPFFAQEQYQCGPAALATVLQSSGASVTPDELTAKIFIPGREGSLQIELLAAARQYNVIPYILNKNLDAILAEVEAGNPVLVLQNLGVNWLPQWHYAVVVGFDFTTSEMILRSGTEHRHVVPMRVFERVWSRSDYWAVVMLPPSRLPATVEQDRYFAAVADAERMKNYAASKDAYKTALQRWPDSLTGLMGLGNSYYALQGLTSAAAVFRMATIKYPDNADAYNNLADTLLQMQRYQDAQDAAKVAVKLGGKHQDIYLQTLRAIEDKLGTHSR